jgi:hypothetical protein
MLNTPSELSADEPVTDDLEETTEELEESTDESLEDEEELEETEDNSEDDEDAEEAFLVGDEKITKSEFEQMKKNQMLHSDYTKKRQAEAAQVKQTVDGLLAQADLLESFLDEDEKAVDWDDFVSNSEMRQAEAKFKERRKKIKQIRDQAAAKKSEADSAMIEETNKAVFDHFADWADNQKQVESDRKLAYDYAQSIGYTDDALNNIDNPQAFISLIEAARMKKELETIKNAKPEKKLKRKTPKNVKGKKAPTKNKSWADVFYS